MTTLTKGSAEPVAVTEDRYREACEGYEGWCDVCGDFTRDCTEPDAEGYECPQCETVNSVCGAEQALVVGKITFGEDTDSDTVICRHCGHKTHPSDCGRCGGIP